jgi:aminopeptidase C
MNKLEKEKWIKERQWEYYSIQIHALLSHHIGIPQHHELIDIYNEYKYMKKDVPIQLQEYISLNLQDVKSLNHKKTYGKPLKDYIKVILISSVLRRQAAGISKINAIDGAAKYFRLSPKIFFEAYDLYSEKAKNLLMVEPDLKGLDKLLGL